MSKRQAQKGSRSLHSYFFPHKGNGYQPHIFSAKGVVVVILFLALVEGAVLFDTKVVQHNDNFTASVLPAVLAGLTNDDRTANGISTLTIDSQLNAAAQLKANDMAANGYFAHVSPTGKTPWYWLKQIGYQYSFAGENLAVNFDDSKAVEDAWMASPTHHANIVKAQYTRVGYGVASGMYEGKQTTFVVQLFATPPAVASVTPTPTPVTKSTSGTSPVKPVIPATVPATPAPTKPAAVTNEAAVPATTPLETQNLAIQDASPAQQVLGAQNIPVQSPNILEQVAASPAHASAYILGTLTMAFLALLLIALYVHLRIRYVEVLGGGALIFAVALALLILNITASHVRVSEGSQSASAVSAFQGALN
ncbi:MAG: hypothetical protein JWL75_606 [Parcubacteria group bacterium]|nr:hypothetical protein [Parcubacteria group bacterium]